MPRQVTALAQWFGSDRTICPKIAALLESCDWIGIPFAGGMSAIRAIRARTINANDLHRGIIALAEMVKQEHSCKTLQQALRQKLFHPDTLRQAQGYLYAEQPPAETLRIAEAYFIVCWMTRSGAAGTDAERSASLSMRWDSGGGDSAKRYYSAIDSLETWCDEFQRCNFTCLDAFEFLAKCKDRQGHGIYIDPPFIGPGNKYTNPFRTATIPYWCQPRCESSWSIYLATHHLRRSCFRSMVSTRPSVNLGILCRFDLSAQKLDGPTWADRLRG